MNLLLRLVALVMIALVPAIGIQAFNQFELRHAREAEGRGEALRLARQTGSEIELTVDGLRELLITLAALPAVHAKDSGTCTAALSALRQQYGAYLTIGAVDDAGRAFCNSTRADRVPDVSDRDYFRRVMAVDDFVVGSFATSRITNRKVINFAYPLHDADGRVSGAVIAGVDLEWLGTHVSRKSFPPDTALAVTDRDGTILVRYPDPESWVGRKVPPRLQPLIRLTQEAVREETGIDGIARIGAIVPVAFGSGGPDFVIGVGLSKPVVLGQIEEAERRGWILIGAAALMAVLAAVAGGWVFIRRPVGRLLAVAQVWQRGDYSARAHLRDRRSEIGRLGRAFDAMAQAVAQRDAALRAAAETLEKRVAERTRELQQTSEELRRSHARSAVLFERSPVLLYVVARRPGDGVFVFEEINPECTRETGFTADALVGRSPREVFPEPAASLMEAKYEECAATGARVEYEVSGRLPVGEVVRRTILVPLLGPDGGVTKVFGTSLDLTAMRQMEEQLRQSQKMEAIGQLTGGVAHDFNNLLSAVLGNLELALMQVPPPPEGVAKYVANAVRAGERGAKLTQQLLAFSRKQHLELEPVEVTALLLRMRDMLAATMGNVIRIDVAPGGDTWPALVDANQLELAVLNLAINARDAMPLGGTLGITTRNLGDGTVPNTAWPADLDRGDYVRISGADTGTGMAPDVLARACEPFFTTKEVGRGSGLGLSQVYGFAKQAGGTVRIESEPGKGTTVHLYLARARRPADDAPAGRSLAPRAATALRVLVVDDDDDVRGLMTASLRGIGHHVAEARSAPEALARLEAEPSAFDLVIADFAMPGMNGAALLEAVRRLDDAIAGLLVTGYANTPAGGLPAGEVQVLHKPFKLGDLGAAVEEAVARLARQRANGRVVPFRPTRR